VARILQSVTGHSEDRLRSTHFPGRHLLSFLLATVLRTVTHFKPSSFHRTHIWSQISSPSPILQLEVQVSNFAVHPLLPNVDREKPFLLSRFVTFPLVLRQLLLIVVQ
jgi:hypothetical protein